MRLLEGAHRDQVVLEDRDILRQTNGICNPFCDPVTLQR